MRFLRSAATVALAISCAALPSIGLLAPSAEPQDSIGAVGPLFFPSALGLAATFQLPHYCSASVVHSESRNLILTAAHCIGGTGRGIEFAPGYHDGISPSGVWDVERVYLDPGWVHGQDPADDVAVLTLAPHGDKQIEDVVPAPTLAAAPAAGVVVTVDGYVAGEGGRPISCTAPTYYTTGYPSFDCDGYSAGVSGGPWLVGKHVVGIIGGLLQGGCSPDTSYSPVFGPAVARLVTRAERDRPSDLAPVPPPSGC